MEKTYSIIIPHKNIPKLLERCLASIPLRDDLEVIIVDDNSDPKVVDFEHFSGKDRPNTTVIFDKSGKGAGRARNVGLEHANGKWLIFADADDFFYGNAFFELDKFSNSNNDIIYFYCNSRDGETGDLIPDRLEEILIAIKEHNYEDLRYKAGVPWGKMVKREVIMRHRIQFEEIPVANDVGFSARVGFYSKQIATIEIPLYCNTRNAGSLYFKRTAERMLIRMRADMRLNEFYKRHNIKYRKTPYVYAFYIPLNHPVALVKALIECRQGESFWPFFSKIIKYGSNFYITKVKVFIYNQLKNVR